MKKFGMIAALVAALCFALVFVGCSGGDDAPFIPSGGDMPGGKKAATKLPMHFWAGTRAICPLLLTLTLP